DSRHDLGAITDQILKTLDTGKYVQPANRSQKKRDSQSLLQKKEGKMEYFLGERTYHGFLACRY
ncbi:MAG: hypothetical protein KDA70_08915, partial [Planctomycetaceae bacterium]|nr:hypothetical protein [Planctomycetaceae bacterium]